VLEPLRLEITNQEIADALSASPGTIETRFREILALAADQRRALSLSNAAPTHRSLVGIRSAGPDAAIGRLRVEPPPRDGCPRSNSGDLVFDFRQAMRAGTSSSISRM
jgi:hypothetical protein